MKKFIICHFAILFVYINCFSQEITFKENKQTIQRKSFEDTSYVIDIISKKVF